MNLNLFWPEGFLPFEQHVGQGSQHDQLYGVSL